MDEDQFDRIEEMLKDVNTSENIKRALESLNKFYQAFHRLSREYGPTEEGYLLELGKLTSQHFKNVVNAIDYLNGHMS